MFPSVSLIMHDESYRSQSARHVCTLSRKRPQSTARFLIYDSKFADFTSPFHRRKRHTYEPDLLSPEVLTTLSDIRNTFRRRSLAHTIAFKTCPDKTAIAVVILCFNFIASVSKVREQYRACLRRHICSGFTLSRRELTVNSNIACNCTSDTLKCV